MHESMSKNIKIKDSEKKKKRKKNVALERVIKEKRKKYGNVALGILSK